MCPIGARSHTSEMIKWLNAVMKSALLATQPQGPPGEECLCLVEIYNTAGVCLKLGISYETPPLGHHALLFAVEHGKALSCWVSKIAHL